ncbi:hypothetical protein [Paraburkholderia sp. BCC1886]|uniref:hypothetical protein n=1 Tax=Paraburkholderia sp. BCC1886 TaxID=2562670 RepID=UPI0011839BE0|nr:hypothetical protein [Paraburkholderia sp. BCC1886]
MTDILAASPALATQPVRIGQERRFPIALSRQIDSIRDLYDLAKQSRWNPLTDIAWARLDTGAYSADALLAARLVWSRRAWLEYPRLSDTPATLIRFCLEPDRESDPKYFLTVKNTEEAWQIETYHTLANALGGYFDRPPQARDESLFDQFRHVSALRAEDSLDAHFTAHCVVEAEVELQLYRAYLDNTTDPVVRQALEQIVTAKERHARFGWLYLDVRSPVWDEAARAAIVERVLTYIAKVALGGLHSALLAGQSELESATDRTALAGLGAVSAQQEVDVLLGALRDSVKRLNALGLDIALPEGRAV